MIFRKFFSNKISDIRIQFIKYLFSGTLVFVFYFTLLIILTEIFKIQHLASLVVAYAVSIITNFLVSKYFVFSNNDSAMQKQFLHFLFIAIFGFSLQFSAVYFFTTIFSLNYFISNIIAAAIIFLISFSLNKFVTFKKPYGKAN